MLFSGHLIPIKMPFKKHCPVLNLWEIISHKLNTGQCYSNGNFYNLFYIFSELDDDGLIDIINAKDDQESILKIWSSTFDILARYAPASEGIYDYDAIVALTTINEGQPIYLARGCIVSNQEKHALMNQHGRQSEARFTRCASGNGVASICWFCTLHTGWCFLDSWQQSKVGEIDYNCEMVTRVYANVTNPQMNAYMLVFASIGIDSGDQLVLRNY